MRWDPTTSTDFPFPEGSGRNYTLFRWVFFRHHNLIAPELIKLMDPHQSPAGPCFDDSFGCLEVPVSSSGEAVMILCAHSCGDTFAFEEVDANRIRVMLREWTPADSQEALEADEAIRDKTRRERALWAFLSSGGALPVRAWVVSGLMLTRAAMDLYQVVLAEVACFHADCKSQCQTQGVSVHRIWANAAGRCPNFRWINDNAAVPWSLEQAGDCVLVPTCLVEKTQLEQVHGAEICESDDPEMFKVRPQAPLTSLAQLRQAILQEALYDCVPDCEEDTFGLFVDCPSVYEGDPAQFEFDCHALCGVLAAVGSSERVRALAAQVQSAAAVHC